AAAGFTNQAQCFSVKDFKGHTVHRAHDVVAVLDGKMLYETAYFDKLLVIRAHLRTNRQGAEDAKKLGDPEALVKLIRHYCGVVMILAALASWRLTVCC